FLGCSRSGARRGGSPSGRRCCSTRSSASPGRAKSTSGRRSGTTFRYRNEARDAVRLTAAAPPYPSPHRSRRANDLGPAEFWLQRRNRRLEPRDDLPRERAADQLLDVSHQEPFVG